MSEPAKTPFQPFFDEIRRILREEIAATKDKADKLLYTTEETAQITGIEDSWLAKKAREREIPHRMVGRYRFFSMEDIEKIIDASHVPMVYSSDSDERTVQASADDPWAEPVETGEAPRGDGDRSGAVGKGGAPNIGTRGAGGRFARGH